MGMCCEKMMMIGWRNAWSMKLRVQGQEKDQRGPGEVVQEDCQARKLNKEDAMDRCKWRKMINDVRWSGWVWVGECFFWYRPTRVVPDKRTLNGCVCVCVCQPNYLDFHRTDFHAVFTGRFRYGCRWTIWTSIFTFSRDVAMATHFCFLQFHFCTIKQQNNTR